MVTIFDNIYHSVIDSVIQLQKNFRKNCYGTGVQSNERDKDPVREDKK